MTVTIIRGDARGLEVPKPPPVADDQESLFDEADLHRHRPGPPRT